MITSDGFSCGGVVCGFQVSYQKAKLCAAEELGFTGLARAVARGLVPWLDPHPAKPIERARTATNRSAKRQTRNMVPHTHWEQPKARVTAMPTFSSQQPSAAIWA